MIWAATHSFFTRVVDGLANQASAMLSPASFASASTVASSSHSRPLQPLETGYRLPSADFGFMDLAGMCR
jgi:hypothetical protein